jgi:hypothetical protein
MAEPQMYNIKDVICMVGDNEIVDASEDGFGITPGQEHTMIKGLQGELGFNIDPSTAATGMVSLKVISPSMKILNQLWKNLTIFRFEIKAKSGKERSLGFKSMYIQYAVFAKPPEYKTDGKEAPSVEWALAGYGYGMTPLD